MANSEQVADSILRIEVKLRELSVWSSESPSAEALQSQQPFCVDTLVFTEWLQFIFLPKMKEIVEQGHPLPVTSGIAPMAEEHFKQRPESGDVLIRELVHIDRLLSGK